MLNGSVLLLWCTNPNAPLFLIGHLGQLDFHPADSLQRTDRRFYVAHNLVLERARDRCKSQGDIHLIPIDPYLPNHAQLYQAPV